MRKKKQNKIYRDKFGRFAKKTEPFRFKWVALFLIMALNWNLLGVIKGTLALFNDQESAGASFAAGTLDFELSSPVEFNPGALAPGESSTRTVEFVNLGNVPKYKVKAADFTGDLCQFLNIDANLKGGDAEFSGKLADFIFGPVVYEVPETWDFTLSLPLDAPEEAQGQTCQFNFIFFGSQTRHNLEFGLGFSDEEQINNNVASKICYATETRSRGYWKNHPNVYFPHLPQSLGCSIADGLGCLYGNEEVDTQAKLLQILGNGYSSSMRNKVRGQLLAMKLNVAHFGVGEYFITSENKTINEIIAEADSLLRQDPAPGNDVLGEMKNLLEGLVDLQVKACSISGAPAPEIPLSSMVVINEFLPNPSGSDSAAMPDGEWVEIYNKSSIPVDLAGWYIYDDSNGHDLPISPNNTDTGSTVVLGGGFLVVYRNGDSNFALNNTGGDAVRLFDGKANSSDLIDSYIYLVGAPEGKSFARIPDGSSNWVDPIPTPGAENNLEGEEVSFGPAISEPDEGIDGEESPQKEETAAGFIDAVIGQVEPIFEPIQKVLNGQSSDVEEIAPNEPDASQCQPEEEAGLDPAQEQKLEQPDELVENTGTPADNELEEPDGTVVESAEPEIIQNEPAIELEVQPSEPASEPLPPATEGESSGESGAEGGGDNSANSEIQNNG